MADIRMALTMDSTGAIKSIKTVEDGLEGVDKKAKKTQSSIEAAFKHSAVAAFAAASAAAGAMAAAFARGTLDAIALGGRMTDLSTKTGISVESLQKLEYAGKLVGVSLDTVSSATAKMQKGLVEGNTAFARLGLSAQALRAMAPEQAIAKIGEQISKIPDPAGRAAAAMEIFGKSGAELLPLLTSDIKAAASEAERLGLVMSTKTAAAADALGDSVDTLSSTWAGLLRQFGTAVVESQAVHTAVKGVTDIIADLSRTVAANKDALIQWVTRGISVALQGLSLLVQSVAIAHDSMKNLQIMWSLIREAGIAGKIGEIPNLPAGSTESQPNIARRKALEAELAALRGARAAMMQGADADLQKMAALAQSLDDLVANIGAAGPASVSFAAGTKKVGEALDFVSKAAADAAAKLSIYRYNVNSYVLPEGGVTRTPFVNVLQDMPELKGGRGVGSQMLGAQAGKTTGASFAAGFKASIAGLPQVIMAAIQGGGDVGRAVGAKLGGDMGKIIGEKLGAHLGANAGKIFGPLGEIAGQILGSAIGKWIGGLFGGGQGKKVNDMRDAFVLAAGGIYELNRAAQAAGLTLDRLLNAKKVKDFDAAMRELQSAFDLQAEAQRLLAEAVERYGLTIEDLGPAWQQQELDKMAAGLLQDYRLLIAGGYENEAVLKQMAGAMNQYVRIALAGGFEIPEAMRPVIQSLIDQKLLVDENGKAYEDADEAGIIFAQSMSDQFKLLIDKIGKLIDALNGIPNISRTVTIDHRDTYSGGDGGGDGDGTEKAAHGFHGVFTGPTTGYRAPLTLHGTERVDVTPGRGGGGSASNSDVVRAIERMGNAQRQRDSALPYLIRDALQQMPR